MPDPASPNGLGFINGGSQDGYGLEWELGFDITPKLGLCGSYAYQDATVDDNNVNVRFAPKHQVYAEANWRFTPQWNLNLNVKSILDRERPAGDPRPPADDYSLLNLTVRREAIGKHLDVAFSVRNLLTRMHASQAILRQGSPPISPWQAATSTGNCASASSDFGSSSFRVQSPSGG